MGLSHVIHLCKLKWTAESYDGEGRGQSALLSVLVILIFLSDPEDQLIPDPVGAESYVDIFVASEKKMLSNT
jgi:hypothetical protein